MNEFLTQDTSLGKNATVSLDKLLIPYPQFASVKTNYNLGRGWYNGFNLNVTRRFHRGFMFQAAYTVSKAMAASSYANVDDRKRNRLDPRLQDDDRPQRLVLNGIYELPFGRRKPLLRRGVASKFMGGWQLSGIGSFMRGRPVAFGGNRSRALAIGIDPNIKPYYDESIGRWVWFNREAFRVRRTGELQNIPQNLPNLRLDGIKNIDVRVTRNFVLHERLRMQFIGESFNVMNRVQWGGPETDIRSVNFGTANHQANLPRDFQFALKFSF